MVFILKRSDTIILLDVVAVPSIAPEPFCMVALEAMASGRPVIASQRGAMVEFISHNETGFIFREPLSPLSMAEDITSALEHPNSQDIAYHAKNMLMIISLGKLLKMSS